MSTHLTITIEGIEPLLARLDSGAQAALLGGPLRTCLTSAALATKAAAMQEAPVDTGTLRRSHATAVDSGALPRWATVGTNVPYAPYVFFGTRPHPVPAGALTGWAGRRGLNANAVARGIAAKGTAKNPWLARALPAAAAGVRQAAGRLGADVEARWQASR